jgi:hypothetical protein
MKPLAEQSITDLTSDILEASSCAELQTIVDSLNIRLDESKGMSWDEQAMEIYLIAELLGECAERWNELRAKSVPKTFTMYHVVHEFAGLSDIMFKAVEEARAEIVRLLNHDSQYWRDSAKRCHIEKVVTTSTVID